MKTEGWLLGALLLSLAGCGDGLKLYGVTGVVTLDNKPMEGLLVIFSPEGPGGFTGTATTGADGSYALRCLRGAGVPAGSYRVSITKNIVVEGGGTDDTYESSDNAAYEQEAAGGSPDDYQAGAAAGAGAIPEKYNSQTILKETVAAEPENQIDFALTSK